jgi:hypothetical protein
MVTKVVCSLLFAGNICILKATNVLIVNFDKGVTPQKRIARPELDTECWKKD